MRFHDFLDSSRRSSKPPQWSWRRHLRILRCHFWFPEMQLWSMESHLCTKGPQMVFQKSWSFPWGLKWFFRKAEVSIESFWRTTHAIFDFLVSLDASLNILQFLRRRQECPMSRLDVTKDLLFATDAPCVAHGNLLWSLMVFKNHNVPTKKSQGAL